MYEEFKELLSLFEKINKKGYIKSFYNNPSNGASLTLKHLIEKEKVNISCAIHNTSTFSRRPIILFSESLNQVISKEMCKYCIKENIMKISPLFSRIKQYGNYNYLLGINYSKEQIYLRIYDEKMMLINQFNLIDFDTLKKLTSQIKLLSVVFARKKIKLKQCYFHYHKMECYRLKSFEDILKALVTSKIKISLKLEKESDFLLVFHINKKDLSSFYQKVFVYEKE